MGQPLEHDAMEKRIDYLEQENAELRQQLIDRDDDLAAARAANRQLMCPKQSHVRRHPEGSRRVRSERTLRCVHDTGAGTRAIDDPWPAGRNQPATTPPLPDTSRSTWVGLPAYVTSPLPLTVADRCSVTFTRACPEPLLLTVVRPVVSPDPS